MKSLSYHGGAPFLRGPYGSGSGAATSIAYGSIECNSGYNLAGLSSGSSGNLTGAGGTFSVYPLRNMTYSGSPVGQLTIGLAGDYCIIGGGTIRTNNTNWILRMGLRINSGTIHATKISGSVANNYHFTCEQIIQTLAVGDTVKLAYNCDFLGGVSTVDFEEGFLTLFKVG